MIATVKAWLEEREAEVARLRVENVQLAAALREAGETVTSLRAQHGRPDPATCVHDLVPLGPDRSQRVCRRCGTTMLDAGLTLEGLLARLDAVWQLCDDAVASYDCGLDGCTHKAGAKVEVAAVLAVLNSPGESTPGLASGLNGPESGETRAYLPMDSGLVVEVGSEVPAGSRHVWPCLLADKSKWSSEQPASCSCPATSRREGTR